MFKLITGELVRTLCSDRTTLGLGHSVIPASSIHEAAFVQLGTFVIKKLPSYSWQPISYEYLSPLTVKIKKKHAVEEITVLENCNKSMDLNNSHSINVATLQFLGMSGSNSEKYSLECELGKVTKLQIREDAIKNYRVPEAVVREYNKTPGKKVLAIVVELYVSKKAATIHFVKKAKEAHDASAHKGASDAESGHGEKSKTDKSFTMVKDQVMAYCIQECKFIPANNTFSLPSSCSDDEE